MRVPRDIVRIIFDCVSMLFMLPLDPVQPKMVNIAKADHPWITDSWDNHAGKLILGAGLLP